MLLTRRRCLAAVATAVTTVVPWRLAQAARPPAEVASEVPGARLVGSGTMRWLGLRVYDARLWAPEPLTQDTWATRPFALELQYARALPGRRIAERSLVEMRRQRELPPAEADRWLDALQRVFPDVAEGDRISGVHKPGQAARFHVNGRYAGELADGEFARLFFGVWLSPQTSEPALRDALLGRTGGAAS